MNANQVFTTAIRTQALVEHPLVKRANLGYQLNQPFAWSLINSAAVFAQLSPEDKAGERGDQMKIKMSTLRHFNREMGSNDIGMGQINACLRPDEKDVALDHIKELARDRIKIERRSGKLLPNAVKARYTQLYMNMYEDAKAKKRALAMLMNDVYHLVNQDDDDEANCDWDGYEYMLEGLLDKCTMPVVRAREEIQRVSDRSYRVEAISACSQLLLECDALSKLLGISWAKLDAESAKIKAELDACDAEDACDDASIDSLLDAADAEFTAADEELTRRTTTIKSPERLAREEAEAKAAAEKVEYAKANATKAAKAKATREANAQAQPIKLVA